jgi:hypothetical protein
MLVVIELGCQEYLVARHAGCLDALPDLLLVIWPMSQKSPIEKQVSSNAVIQRTDHTRKPYRYVCSHS